VTTAEYVEFLNDLVSRGLEEEALSACPRSQLGMDDPSERLLFGRQHGRFDVGGDDPDGPVLLVDWHGARAFAMWTAARTARPWRLSNELEREKAARGADARLCPWGDYLDATFACTLDSHTAKPARASVKSYPIDESVYGIRGLAGNSRDWCGNVWRREGPAVTDGRLEVEAVLHDTGFRALRGGAWCSPLVASRSAGRFGGPPAVRRMTTGARLARSL
jgi:serine/threonine-protein kinase